MKQTFTENFWSDKFHLLASKREVLFIIKIRIFQFFGLKAISHYQLSNDQKIKRSIVHSRKNLVCILYQKLMSPHCAVIMILPQCWLKTTFCVVVK